MDVREKLVELLADLYSCDPAYYDVDAWAIAQHLVDHAVAFQKWISVDDRLPEDSGYYLVVHRDKYNGSISIAFDMYVKCNVGEWWESEFACDITKQFLWATRLQDQEVTHWMPFPHPPKGE